VRPPAVWRSGCVIALAPPAAQFDPSAPNRTCATMLRTTNQNTKDLQSVFKVTISGRTQQAVTCDSRRARLWI